MCNDEFKDNFHAESGGAGDQVNEHDFEHVDHLNQQIFDFLKTVNWEIRKDRCALICRLHTLIRNCEGQPPHPRDIFRPEEIDLLVTDSLSYWLEDLDKSTAARFVEFVARSGYEDKPKVDGNGELLLQRTTPVHHASLSGSIILVHAPMVHELFKVYNRFDVNYMDKSGLTHFHVACELGFDDLVQEFLELGQDPNCPTSESVNPPLHLALARYEFKVAELLLKSGADPNFANAEGLTPLHVICKRKWEEDQLEMLFEICDEKNQLVRVDAQDKLGNTPLHLALRNSLEETATFLVRMGADPNLTNAEGFTPLHIICKSSNNYSYEVVKKFLKINAELDQLVQIDAQDNEGRTPLQLAVANCNPNLIDVLLDHEADLSKFVFPTESYFGMGYKPKHIIYDSILVSGALAVVERLCNRGYELDRSDALIIMRLVEDCDFLNQSVSAKGCFRNDECSARIAKEIMIKNDNDSDLSLHDLIQLRPKEATKKLTYSDYYEFAMSAKLWRLPQPHRNACGVHLCEKQLRGFFRQWALDPFKKLIHYRLPLECFEFRWGMKNKYNISRQIYLNSTMDPSIIFTKVDRGTSIGKTTFKLIINNLNVFDASYDTQILQNKPYNFSLRVSVQKLHWFRTTRRFVVNRSAGTTAFADTSTPTATPPARSASATRSAKATAEENWRVVGRSRRRSSATTTPVAEQERRTTAATETTTSPVRTYNLFEQLNNVLADVFRDTPRRNAGVPRVTIVPGSRHTAEETGIGDRHRPDRSPDVRTARCRTHGVVLLLKDASATPTSRLYCLYIYCIQSHAVKVNELMAHFAHSHIHGRDIHATLTSFFLSQPQLHHHCGMKFIALCVFRTSWLVPGKVAARALDHRRSVWPMAQLIPNVLPNGPLQQHNSREGNICMLLVDTSDEKLYVYIKYMKIIQKKHKFQNSNRCRTTWTYKMLQCILSRSRARRRSAAAAA
ncbi:unnamed protein product [Trichogramma brassicae]|uniref:Uncharacterized protein n=1 Tax=Trichogramma brassicae TaxID=86971 RepID=A0A6H5HUA4_9HYME|nr:unnamed protein product [Trichogramma brassicae]